MTEEIVETSVAESSSGISNSSGYANLMQCEKWIHVLMHFGRSATLNDDILFLIFSFLSMKDRIKVERGVAIFSPDLAVI